MILTYILGSSKAKGYKAVGGVSAHAKLFFHVSGNQARQVTQLPLNIHTGLSLSRQTLIFFQKIFTGRDVLPGCIFIPLKQRSLSPCPWKVKLHTAWTVSLFLRTDIFLTCPTNDSINQTPIFISLHCPFLFRKVHTNMELLLLKTPGSKTTMQVLEYAFYFFPIIKMANYFKTHNLIILKFFKLCFTKGFS